MADELIHPLRELVAEYNSEALACDGFDDAIIGVAERFGMPVVAAYDYDKVIEKIMADGCTREEAIEHFEFNILGAWVGETTPLFVTLFKKPGAPG